MTILDTAGNLQDEILDQELTSFIMVNDGKELFVCASGNAAHLAGSLASMMYDNPMLIGRIIDALLLLKVGHFDHSDLDRIIIAGERDH